MHEAGFSRCVRCVIGDIFKFHDVIQFAAHRNIGHLQIADNPHRGEPGTGEINYDYLFKVIENSDYNGWVGCEYKPQTTTEAGLRWMDPYR